MSRMACSLARTLDIVGEWWTPLILRDLFAGITRFEDIRRDLGIASNVLTDRLGTLVQHAVVEQRQYQDNPVRFDYLLTAQGRELFPALAMLMAWGDKWRADNDGPPAQLVHEDCGAVTQPLIVCGHCREQLQDDRITLTAGPGGRSGPGTEVIGPLLAQREAARSEP